MSDFLLELRSEEIPARMQKSARAELERLFAAQMAIAGLGGAGLGGAGLDGAGLGGAGLGGAGLGRAGLGGAGLGGAGLGRGAVTSWSTPRRVALIARGLPVKTAAVSKRVKGPRVGSPPRALEGFLRKVEQTRDQLTQQDGIWFAEISGTTRATAEVLAQAVPAIIRAFNWPKSMRWGAASQTNESLRWVRPLSGIIALLGDDIVACEVDGIIAGRETKGHRFHYHGGGEDYGEGRGVGRSGGEHGNGERRGVGRSGGDISIANAADYAPKLRAAHVIVDQDERAAIIRDGASQAASQAGLALIEDEALVLENAGLTEWPVPLLGRFERDFLSLPPEVIRLTARTNQKYFTLNDHKGKLANAFVCTANIAASDGGAALVAGNEKVLAARLADARFFWEQDRKISLAAHAEKLGKIIFHEGMGTLAEKVQRVVGLAYVMAEKGVIPGADAKQAEQAALLCKVDLVTAMVGEFPELQGVMGGYYAQAEGYAPQVVAAIRDHYKPAGQGDDVPTAPLTVALSLADKLDTLSLFFLHRLVPSGSKDPYALRRIANGIIEIILQNQLRISLTQPILFPSLLFTQVKEVKHTYKLEDQKKEARKLLPDSGVSDEAIELERVEFVEKIKKLDPEVIPQEKFHPIAWAVMAFLVERLKVQQREAGVRHDLIDAVFVLDWDIDLVLLLARVKALQTFVETSNGANLLAGYKRAANILGKAGWGEQAGDKTDSEQDEKLSKASPPNLEAVNLEPSEIRLIEALGIAEAKVDNALAKENFTGAMNSLASLRKPIDNFFENTMVNDPDPAIRVRRLSLLARFRAAAHRVADFSKIEVQK